MFVVWTRSSLVWLVVFGPEGLRWESQEETRPCRLGVQNGDMTLHKGGGSRFGFPYHKEPTRKSFKMRDPSKGGYTNQMVAPPKRHTQKGCYASKSGTLPTFGDFRVTPPHGSHKTRRFCLFLRFGFPLNTNPPTPAPPPKKKKRKKEKERGKAS